MREQAMVQGQTDALSVRPAQTEQGPIIVIQADTDDQAFELFDQLGYARIEAFIFGLINWPG